jgi:DNA-binding NarL/FixJ family response regulator
MSHRPIRVRAATRKSRILVCVLEGNQLAAHYLQEILEGEPEIEILSERFLFVQGVEAKFPPPIFAIDIDSLTKVLTKCLVAISSRFPEAKSLLIGEGVSRARTAQFPFLSVCGFLSYSDVKMKLGTALRTVANGGNWFATGSTTGMVSFARTFERRGTGFDERGQELFTAKERLIVGFVEQRMCNKEIGAKLKISEGTVKFHLSNIFRKLGVHDRYAAADLAAIGRSSVSREMAVMRSSRSL